MLETKIASQHASVFLLLAGLADRNVRLDRLCALEMFGYTGIYQTVCYGYIVKSLEIWEIEPKYIPILTRRFPSATVLQADAYREVAATDHKFGLVMIDNPIGEHQGHYEHFDLFPAIFGLFDNTGFLVLNVVPKPKERLTPAHLEARARFYGAGDPADIPLPDIEAAYRAKALEAGWKVVAAFEIKRSQVHYLALELRRISG